MKQILLLVVLGILTSACVSQHPHFYLSQGELPTNVTDSVKLVIQQDDILSIKISDEKSGAVSPFNIKSSYLVNNYGNIQFPILGELHLEGLTKLEAIHYIVNKLKPYLKTAIVHLEITNFKITVLGEVANPGVFINNHEKISILEILGRAGDLTQYGNPEKITIIRKLSHGVKHIELDLTQANLTASPYYYLLQNDVIYVQSTKEKRREKNQSKLLFITSTFTSLFTALALGFIIIK